jgi:nucleotide-binding universal stress UspA family protein
MFRKVLVPLDGSDRSATALDFLKPVLQIGSASIVVLRVLDEGQSRPGPAADSGPDHFSDRLDRLESVAEISSLERRGDAAQQILAVAAEQGVSLVVMATHGRTGLSRLVRGSVAERVLRNSAVPVLLTNPFTKPTATESPIRRILVPLDGSPLSAAVVPLVADLARVYGSRVTLFHVALPESHESPQAEDRERIGEEEFREWARPFVSQLEDAGAAVSVKVVHEFGPADQILKRVDDRAVDLVALTTHGRSGLDRWLYGSVAELVVRQCRAPLLVKRTALTGGGECQGGEQGS